MNRVGILKCYGLIQCTSRNYASKTYLLHEFFDHEHTFGKFELSPKFRPGRSWSQDELRLKSNSDLHKLWFVLLKERNMLLTMKEAYSKRNRFMPCPERIDKIDTSMKNLEFIVHERNDAYLRLETGDGVDPPMRTVTTQFGFTIEKPSTEHYEPWEITGEKEYYTPYLESDVWLFQKLWKEKEHMKSEITSYDNEISKKKIDPTTGVDVKKEYRLFKRSFRRTYNNIDQLPEQFKPKI